MRTIPLRPLALLVLVVLAACAPVGTRELHEVALVRADGATKLRYVYGSADRMVLNGRERVLGGIVGDAAAEIPYAVGAARTVDGAPFLRTALARPFEAPVRVDRIPLSSDLRVTTTAPVERLLYYDGARWLALGRDLAAGRTSTVVPAPASGRLLGLGDLAPAEADAIADALEAGGEAVVALLADDAVAAATGSSALAPAPADGLEEYRHTALWIQDGLAVDPAAYVPPPAEVIVDVVARGDQGRDPGEDRFELIADEEALRAFWNEVQAASFAPPPLPEADFARETLLGVRLAQRPTGGYGIEVVRVVREEGDLYADVRRVEPAPDAIVTQALTTPWALVRLLGERASAVWFRDADTGEIIGVARAGDPAGL